MQAALQLLFVLAMKNEQAGIQNACEDATPPGSAPSHATPLLSRAQRRRMLRACVPLLRPPAPEECRLRAVQLVGALLSISGGEDRTTSIGISGGEKEGGEDDDDDENGARTQLAQGRIAPHKHREVGKGEADEANDDDEAETVAASEDYHRLEAAAATTTSCGTKATDRASRYSADGLGVAEAELVGCVGLLQQIAAGADESGLVREAAEQIVRLGLVD